MLRRGRGADVQRGRTWRKKSKLGKNGRSHLNRSIHHRGSLSFLQYNAHRRPEDKGKRRCYTGYGCGGIDISVFGLELLHVKQIIALVTGLVYKSIVVSSSSDLRPPTSDF